MEDDSEFSQSHPRSIRGPGRKYVIALSLIVGVEALAVLAGAVYFLARMFMEPVDNLPGAIVILLIAIAIGIGLVVVTIACWRNKPWTRGAIVTWQVLQFAVATSFIQGIAQWQPAGWVLFLFSAAAIILVFIPATTREMTSRSS